MTPAVFALIVTAALLLSLAAIGLIGLLLLQAQGAGRLQTRLQGQDGVAKDPEFSAGDGNALLTWLAQPGRRLEGWLDSRDDGAEGESARLLLQAGWRDASARLLFYVFQTLAPLLAALIALVLWVFGEARGILPLLYTLMLVTAAVLAPRWLLRHTAAARRRQIKNEVPLFLHLLVLLFEAGLSTRQAIASLVREGRGVLPELGREFEIVLRSLEAGGDTAEVLRGLGEMLDVPDLAGVLSVLRQVDRYGGEIREPLMDTMHVLEERRDLDLRERVNRMSGKMTVVMVLFFFPALLIFVAGPAFISILKALAEATAR
jgi:tight adherence protein C